MTAIQDLESVNDDSCKELLVVRQGSVGSVGRVGRCPKVGGIIVGCILIGKCLDAVLTFWSKKLNNSHFFRDKNALNLYISVLLDYICRPYLTNPTLC
ncbi:MAG: hypothetical protein QNJ68_24055 [Microcoleaceae cyanobacterium MO_207.B10]|nr:hypothetical protein [Microcoleaceae cyanobacterium MO_207.B10]